MIFLLSGSHLMYAEYLFSFMNVIAKHYHHAWTIEKVLFK